MHCVQSDCQPGPAHQAGEGLLAASRFWRDQLQLLQSSSGAVLIQDGSIIRRISHAVRLTWEPSCSASSLDVPPDRQWVTGVHAWVVFVATSCVGIWDHVLIDTSAELDVPGELWSCSICNSQCLLSAVVLACRGEDHLQSKRGMSAWPFRPESCERVFALVVDPQPALP